MRLAKPCFQITCGVSQTRDVMAVRATATRAPIRQLAPDREVADHGRRHPGGNPARNLLSALFIAPHRVRPVRSSALSRDDASVQERYAAV